MDAYKKLAENLETEYQVFQDKIRQEVSEKIASGAEPVVTSMNLLSKYAYEQNLKHAIWKNISNRVAEKKMDLSAVEVALLLKQPDLLDKLFDYFDERAEKINVNNFIDLENSLEVVSMEN